MSLVISELNLEQLTSDQKIELIGKLWDSIPETELLPIPQWHREELDRRLKDADATPDAGIPWEQVKTRLRGEP